MRHPGVQKIYTCPLDYSHSLTHWTARRIASSAFQLRSHW